MTRIGEVISEKLDIIPQKITVKLHICHKYACRSCEGLEGDGPTVKIASMSSAIN
ncbi:IS66 family transposase zinc-finger binding domain-containing protein [Desulfovibrio sp. UCD-KL4C]|uniref:IS66 family transposase zinc-finger binding domain-containing protein n=1 Tax=Desulfovibrio sp. UCD-KL4C TaxID=2578120 RepID=UPI0025C73D6B|nr:IS66 family transposase zinc-finger binding domain-containing protein [Desulfovibrio sp. UCD-KL4C]